MTIHDGYLGSMSPQEWYADMDATGYSLFIIRISIDATDIVT